MCKVLIMSGIKEEHSEKAISFIKTMAPLMSKANDDGLGYAAVNKNGELFGERWLINNTAFSEVPVVDKKITEVFSGAIKNANHIIHNKFGKGQLSDAVAITLHTRMATSSRGFSNTHPFVLEDMSVIHNGVIRNPEIYKEMMESTCDSESIICSYVTNDISNEPQAIQQLADELKGYYAAAVFGKDNRGKRHLDIFKAHNNNLSLVWINELETYVFSTSEYDVKDACSKLGFTTSKFYDVEDGKLIRMNPFTGEVLFIKDFTPGKQWEQSNTNYNKPVHYNVTHINKHNHNKVNKNINKQVNTELIEYYKKPFPSITELSETEVQNFLKASGVDV